MMMTVIIIINSLSSLRSTSGRRDAGLPAVPLPPLVLAVSPLSPPLVSPPGDPPGQPGGVGVREAGEGGPGTAPPTTQPSLRGCPAPHSGVTPAGGDTAEPLVPSCRRGGVASGGRAAAPPPAAGHGRGGGVGLARAGPGWLARERPGEETGAGPGSGGEGSGRASAPRAAQLQSALGEP